MRAKEGQVEKLIYARKSTARAQATRLSRKTGAKHDVYPVTKGYQVCRITVYPPFRHRPLPPASWESEPAPELQAVSGRIYSETTAWVCVTMGKKSWAWLYKRKLVDVQVKGKRIGFRVDPDYLRRKIEIAAQWEKENG
jgi:hypothetical protein